MKVYSFGPVINNNSKVLILGTLPGCESLLQRQYYANPRNDFWRILESIFGEPVGDSYDDKLSFLRGKGIALWDVLLSGEREGSSDRKIKNAVPNDFASLLQNYPGLKALAFNGYSKYSGWRYFQRLVLKQRRTDNLESLMKFHLASTSPAYALRVEQKVEEWRVIAQILTDEI